MFTFPPPSTMPIPPAGARKQRMVEEIASLLWELPREQDLRDFLISFLTPLELQRLHTRILVATELLQGSSVSSIREKLSVGYTSVRPVDILLSRLLPGYRASLPALLAHPESSRKRGLERLKTRSPLLASLAAMVQQ